MTTTNHAITVTIDGSNRTTSLLRDTLRVRNSLQNNASVADFVVEESQGYIPQAWDEVYVAVNGTNIFGGFVTNRNAMGLAGSATRVRWSLSARDWTALFDKLIVTAWYTDRTDSAIVTSLIDTYLAGEGFTKSQIQFTQSNITIAFENLTLRQALNKLADQVGAAWTVTANKGFYWFNKWKAYPAAFNINTVSPDNSTTYTVLKDSLKRQIDDQSAINRVTVVGANLQGGYTREDFTVGNDDRQWGPTEYAIHSFVQVTVEDTEGNTRAVFSGDQIGYEPDAILMDWQNPVQAAITGQPKVEVLVNREKRTFKIESAVFNTGYPEADWTIIVAYFISVPLQVSVDDEDLQALHGRVFEYQAYAPTIADEETATYYGLNLLQSYGYGRETVSFDIPQYGLVPGRQIEIYSPQVDISSVVIAGDILLQDFGGWLAESGVRLIQECEGVDQVSQIDLQDGGAWLLEDSAAIRTEFARDIGSYIIQEVSYRVVATPAGHMVIASVTCGEYQQTIIDILSQLAGSGAVGTKPTANLRGRVSDIASDLGEIVAGRAVLTDAGTATFTWTDPAGHTGVVVGLDNSVGTVPPTGKLLILDAGTVRAMLGPMQGLPAVGTVTPSGFGLWTNNGYFSGEVAASRITGSTISAGVFNGGTVDQGNISAGTISGAHISGGTITGGYVSGGTVSGALIYGGTIRTSPNPVNSSNPGAYIDSTGIFGYGTAGLTFKIPTDPADRPVFSSGTILNTVYEVTTSAVIRTGTINPKIQIDNSGIFAYNPSGTAMFTVDAATGRMTASDGIFSGSVSASQITGGTVTGGRISGGTVAGGVISGGTVSGALVTAGTVSGAAISGGTISGGYITGGTVNGAQMNAGTVASGTISGNYITGGTIYAAVFNGGTVDQGNISAGTISGALISGGTVSGGLISGGTVSGATITTGAASNITFSGDRQNMNYGTALSDASIINWWAGGANVAQIYANNDDATHHTMYMLMAGTGDRIVMRAGNSYAFEVNKLGIGVHLEPDSRSLLNIGRSDSGWYSIYLSDWATGAIRQLYINNGTIAIA